jgi:hypothetical protein
MALGGLTGSPLNTISSINGLGSTGLTHNGTGLDALTSPYSGIQQYAGMAVWQISCEGLQVVIRESVKRELSGQLLLRETGRMDHITCLWDNLRLLCQDFKQGGCMQ